MTAWGLSVTAHSLPSTLGPQRQRNASSTIPQSPLLHTAQRAATRHASDPVHNKRRVRAIEPLKKFTHTTAFKPRYIRADPKFSFVLQKSSIRHTSLQNIKGSANPHAPRHTVAPSSGPVLDRLSSSSSDLQDQDSSTFGAHALSNATELPSSPMLDQATSSDRHYEDFSTSDGAHALSNATELPSSLDQATSSDYDQDSSTSDGAHAISNAAEIPSSPMLDQVSSTGSGHDQDFSTSDGAHAISNAGAPSALLRPRCFSHMDFDVMPSARTRCAREYVTSLDKSSASRPLAPRSGRSFSEYIHVHSFTHEPLSEAELLQIVFEPDHCGGLRYRTGAELNARADVSFQCGICGLTRTKLYDLQKHWVTHPLSHSQAGSSATRTQPSRRAKVPRKYY